MDLIPVAVSEQPLARPPPITRDDPQAPKPKKNRGKGAKQRSSEKYLHASNAKTMAALRAEKQKRLGVFNQDAAELEKSLRSMMVTVQPRAIPLPVATRGVGFSAVAEYSRMTSAWNQETVVNICTIYQYYRVSLFLLSFKIFQSRYVQHREESYPLSPRFVMNEEYRQVLQTVAQVPLSTHNILCAVGVVEGESHYNAYFPEFATLATGQDAALYVNPFNIRTILERLADANSDADHRLGFYNLNPLPGARWLIDPEQGHVLQNADQIWPPNYNAENLSADVSAYCNLLTRAGNRLPKSFLVNFDWNSYGTKSLAVSMYSVPSRLNATFTRTTRPVTRKKTRGVDGQERDVAHQADEYVYAGDIQTSSPLVIECWSIDGTANAMEMTVGAATYVGEVETIQTRLQVQGRLFSHLSPGSVLYKMVDSPRT